MIKWKFYHTSSRIEYNWTERLNNFSEETDILSSVSLFQWSTTSTVKKRRTVVMSSERLNNFQRVTTSRSWWKGKEVIAIYGSLSSHNFVYKYQFVSKSASGKAQQSKTSKALTISERSQLGIVEWIAFEFSQFQVWPLYNEDTIECYHILKLTERVIYVC